MSNAAEIEIREGVERETVEKVQALAGNYKYGFTTDVETEYAPKGLNEDIVRLISAKKNEPEWLLEWRLDAFERWKAMPEPEWAMVSLSAHRLPGSVLLRPAQELQREAQIAGRGRS